MGRKGFIGAELIQDLRFKGHNVYCCDINVSTDDPYNLKMNSAVESEVNEQI